MPDTAPLVHALRQLDIRKRARLIHIWGTQADQAYAQGAGAEFDMLSALVMLLAEVEVELHEEFQEFKAGHENTALPPRDPGQPAGREMIGW